MAHESDNTSSASSEFEFYDDNPLPDIGKLNPYDYEPTHILLPSDFSDVLKDSDNTDSEENKSIRIGNTNWCQCGYCKPMLTFTESLCCRNTNEVPDNKFEGMLLL